VGLGARVCTFAVKELIFVVDLCMPSGSNQSTDMAPYVETKENAREKVVWTLEPTENSSRMRRKLIPVKQIADRERGSVPLKVSHHHEQSFALSPRGKALAIPEPAAEQEPQFPPLPDIPSREMKESKVEKDSTDGPRTPASSSTNPMSSSPSPYSSSSSSRTEEDFSNPLPDSLVSNVVLLYVPCQLISCWSVTNGMLMLTETHVYFEAKTENMLQTVYNGAIDIGVIDKPTDATGKSFARAQCHAFVQI
jgi:hypothetical protein